MIVLAILSGLMILGLPRLQGQKNNIKKVVRQVATLSREIRTYARLKRMTYRLAIRLDEQTNKEGKKEPAGYWVESAAGNVMVPSEATFERMEKGDENLPANPFQRTDKPLKGFKELPDGIKFTSVETPAHKEALTKGMAYVYYTPEGLVERAIIQISNQNNATWSLILNPLTGQADVVEKPTSLKDLKFE
jgi:general secretion pathway protein H